MTAPLFLLDEGAAAVAQVGGSVTLGGAEGRHAVAVARIDVGEQIDLADGRGTILHAEVLSVVGRDSLVARVRGKEVLDPPQPRLVVVQAIPKGDRAQTAVETLTEVGVDAIVPWHAQRCIARWTGARADRGRSRWEAVARAAGKQSRRAWLPEVVPVASTAEVARRIAAATLAIVLHEEAERPLGGVAMPPAGEVVVVVGPEGGLTPAEVDEFTAVGAVAARLGPSVLRTSTAGTVAAGILLSRTDRWA